MEKRAIISSFISRFGLPPRDIISVPGRINILGEHTDYNFGLVLPATIDKYIHFAYSEDPSGDISVEAAQYSSSYIFSQNTKAENFKDWRRYFQNGIYKMTSESIQSNGIKIVFGGDLPIGAGLSSSTAITCGFISVLDKVNQWELDKPRFIQFANESENLTGLGGGILDQFAIASGKANTAQFLNCHSLEYKNIPLDIEPFSFVLINSNVQHELVNSEYSHRKKDCLDILKEVQSLYPEVKTVSQILPQYLKNIDSKNNLHRVEYILEENERVHQIVAAFEAKNVKEIGRLLYEGHDGMKDKYEITCPEIDFLIQRCKEEPSILGARMIGGGFGGCILCVADHHFMASNFSALNHQYEKEFGLSASILPIKIVDGLYAKKRGYLQ